MTRLNSTVLLALTFTVGLVFGVAVDRGGSLSAQSTGSIRPLAIPSTAEPPGAEDVLYEQLARQYDHFEQVNRTFELVSRVVSPTVVHITARKPGRVREGRPRPSFVEESGSGVIVRSPNNPATYVLTNNHVVAGAEPQEIRITLHDGRNIRPVDFWADDLSDIAVLRLGQDDLPAARLGDSDAIAVGTWVLAVGSPFGLTHSVSQGIISARGRHEVDLLNSGVINQDFLQTDAAINPGNSGGPLVNLKGEVIGINTAIASHGGGNEGVGYSIPINLARWAMDQLIASGRVRRGAMGVQLEEIFPEDVEVLGLDRPRGARIRNVTEQSPAALGGIRKGDVVVLYNGILVVDTNHLINLVAMTPIGASADLIVWRDGREIATRVTVADREATLALGSPELKVPSRIPGPGGNESTPIQSAPHDFPRRP
ncbi:hypothetical protein BH23PLA1_BH23PLA1_35330 [soil metagenome]